MVGTFDGVGSLSGVGSFTAVEPPSYFGLFNVGNTLYKWDFANDTVSTSSATLTSNTNYMGTHSNVGTAGYAQSGAGTTNFTGNKISYAPITTSAMASAPVSRNQPSGGAGNTGSAGYVFGGSGVSIQNSTNKVSYSNDVQSTLNNSGSHNLVGGAAASNVGVAALIQRSNSSGNLRKMSYSNETVADAGNFPTTSGAGAAVATNGNTAAYFYFGYTTALSAVVHKVLFSNDTTSTLSSTATPARYFSTGIYRTGQAGYFLGGNNLLGSTNKISFSTDTFSVSTTVNTGVATNNTSSSVSNGG